jgi:hypothetical protein
MKICSSFRLVFLPLTGQFLLLFLVSSSSSSSTFVDKYGILIERCERGLKKGKKSKKTAKDGPPPPPPGPGPGPGPPPKKGAKNRIKLVKGQSLQLQIQRSHHRMFHLRRQLQSRQRKFVV